MKRKCVLTILVVGLLFLCCNTKVSAAWAQVTAVLPADKTTVSSGYALFEAVDMYGSVNSISRYPIKFQAIRSDKGTGEGTAYQQAVVNVGQEYTCRVKDPMNYHKIRLTGWNIDSAEKGCIGYGYITD